MENVHDAPPLLLELVRDDSFRGDPFVLVDVGCGLGLDPAWRLFGESLHAYGFDAQIEEIERLQRAEQNPNVRYYALLVGSAEPPPQDPYFDPFARSSAVEAKRITAGDERGTARPNDWPGQRLAQEQSGLSEFLRAAGVERVDFVKIDTDGSDLQVIRSFEDSIRSSQTLGFLVEVPFTGSADDGVHTFHNVDRTLKRYGFLLCDLTVHRNSRAVLPAPFQYRLFGSTAWGQPTWADAVYLRDAGHPDYLRFGELPPSKLLKLACLYELFRLPDCAVEILLSHREQLTSLVDVERLLDLLTPSLDGQRVDYRDYVAVFEQDPTRFYPDSNIGQDVRALLRDAKQLAAHVIRRRSVRRRA